MKLEDGTEEMFNKLYVKYTPLVRLMMYTFQNPLFKIEDLKQEFEKGNGLSAKINNIPINDLLYGYYESAFHVQNLFDSLTSKGTWQKYNEELDSKMMETEIDETFISNSIELFTNFYRNRLKKMIENNTITREEAIKKFEEFQKVSFTCKSYYSSIKGKYHR